MVDDRPPVVLDARFEGSDDSEDEDYDPSRQATKDAEVASNDGEEEEGDFDSGDEKTVSHVSKTRSDAVPHRDIKTRSQRAARSESIEVSTPAASNVNVDDLWAAMNAPKTSQVKASTEEETVTIEREYVFAGETHKETKTVPKQSQEAKDHFASLEEARQTKEETEKRVPVKLNDSGKPLRKVFKRKSTLVDPRPRKLNTLEKSRMEWSGFVDREGINEDLKRGNQAGYLDKMDFLKKSELKVHDQFKAGQRSSLAKP